MAVFRLPVSGLEVVLREPTGVEDILLAEGGACDARLALALGGALAVRADGGPVDWAALPVTDLDAALLGIRQVVIGDLIRSTAVCSGARGCGARVDVAFRISELLAHQQPSSPRGVVPQDEPGWFRLTAASAGSEGIVFRLPSGADLVAANEHPDAAREIARRCIRPEKLAAALRRRVEAAMEALAPSLYTDLEGVCPECGVTVLIPFDPQHYVLGELRERAVFVYEEVHLIAGRYHWPEQAILALPQARRARYAEMVHQQRNEAP